MNKNLFLFIVLPVLLIGQPSEFNADSTYSYIEHLSVTIGPRPMGSEKEQQALNWAREKFSSFGADTVFTMNFTTAEINQIHYNTNSGVTVGIFRGLVDSAIVVGGHIDSDDWETPGANDNASGSATTLELARIWGERSRHYTMIFCVFGGEERGLLGSNHFVANYEGIDKVSLMISTDMSASDGAVVTMFETDSVQAPKWLVRDAFSIADEVGFEQLLYATHYSTLNNLGPNGAGSDHKPFLNIGIPAIDFTAGVNESPIHTQMDRLDFVEKPALGRYGNFVDKLLLTYQHQGIPSQDNSEFVFWKFLGMIFYIPVWLIKAFIVLSILLAGYSFIVVRKKRTDKNKAGWIKFTALKLLGLFTLIMIFIHLGEGFIQLFSGYRYAWLTHLEAYLWYTVIWVIAGVWVALQITKKWIFNNDPYIYALRFFIVLFVYTVLTSSLNARLAAYPALVLCLLSLAVLVRLSWLKVVLVLLAVLPMARLIFNEIFPFLSRGGMMAGFMIDNWVKALMFNGFLTAILIVWFLPLIYSFGFLIVTNPAVKNLLKYFRKPIPGAVVFTVIIGFGVYLITLPAYNDMWRPGIKVIADYNMTGGSGELTVKGNEYFKDVHIKTDSLDQQYNSRIQMVEIPQSFKADWVSMCGMEVISPGEKDTVSFNWIIQSSKPWIKTTVTVKTDTAGIYDPISDLALTHKKNTVKFTWYGDIPDSLNMKGSLVIEPGAKLIRRVNAVYRDMPVDIIVTSDLAMVKYRTKVEYQDTLSFEQ